MEPLDRIEGRNPVREALRGGRAIRRVLVAQGVRPHGAIDEIVRAAREAGVRVDRVPRDTLDRMATGRVHQGVIAEAEPYRYRSWGDAVEAAVGRGERPLLVALDGITDPGNFGSLLRSAEALGAHAVIVPERRSSPVTPVVEKAAAGALSHLVLDRVTNLERTLERCKAKGIWVVGLDGHAPADVWSCELLTEPVVLVVGAEGKGLSRLVADRADMLVRIPLGGRVASLNAGVAGAIALFETRRRRLASESS